MIAILKNLLIFQVFIARHLAKATIVEDKFLTEVDFVCTPNKFVVLDVSLAYGNPDGGAFRAYITTNGVMPAPEIRITLGDCIEFEIRNNLPTEELTIHYHGISMLGSPWQDGVAFITECPTPPGSIKKHIFQPVEAGTFMYHSHVEDQISDGLIGLFIVEDNDTMERKLTNIVDNSDDNDDSDEVNQKCFPPQSESPICIPEDEFDEYSLLITDWWHQDSRTQASMLTSQQFVWIGDPMSILFNGVGMVDPASSPELTSSVSFKSGITYRMRIGCGTSLSFIRWGIEGHKLQIIAADGLYTEPLETDYIDCSSGQRYDVLVKMDDPYDNGGIYWMYAHTRYRNNIVMGGLRLFYDDVLDTTLMPESTLAEILEQALPSDHNDGNSQIAAEESVRFEMQLTGFVALPDEEVTKEFKYVVSQQRMSKSGDFTYTPYDESTKTFTLADDFLDGYLKWALNNHSFPKLETPILFSAVLGLYEQELSDEELIEEIEYGDYVQIVIQNGLSLGNGVDAGQVMDQHPMHLHGHSFWVVGYGVGDYDPETDPEKFNLLNPIRRDTVVVYPYSWAVIRFKADNPGAWFFHCHIGAHTIMGMSLTILEAKDMIPPPTTDSKTCGQVGYDVFSNSYFVLEE